jgi:hypothetical protein
MQLRRIFASTLFFGLLLPLAATIPVLGSTPPQPGCMIPTVGAPDAGNPPLEPRTIRLTLTNDCGKDVTAVGLHFEGPGVAPWDDSADAIMALAELADGSYYQERPDGPEIHPDIFRAGISRSFERRVDGDAPFYTVTVTCALFLDHTAVGDPIAITTIKRARNRIYLPAAEEDFQILSKLQALGYPDARHALQEGRFKAKLTNAPYLKELEMFAGLEDETHWRARVQRMLDRERKTVQALKDHADDGEVR